MCKRGDVYYVDFGHNIESCKQSGIRPAVIVSNNRANVYSPVITVVPLTSRIHKKRSLPTHVYIPRGCGTGLPKSSMALAEQVETIDKKIFTGKERICGRCCCYGKDNEGASDPDWSSGAV